jgi:hypothetical protein
VKLLDDLRSPSDAPTSPQRPPGGVALNSNHIPDAETIELALATLYLLRFLAPRLWISEPHEQVTGRM